MQKLLKSLMAGLVLISTATALAAAQVLNQKVEKRQIKAHQKEERKGLKLQQKYRKQSLKGRPLPKSVRAQMKHEMRRDARALREKQKNERQDLKDRQRLMKESEKQTRTQF